MSPVTALALALVTLLVLTALVVGPTEGEGFAPMYLSGPTKCFSCERDMIARHGNTDFAWMGQPSKSFDSERQLAQVHPQYANRAHGTKCFSCEEQADGGNGHRGA